MKIVVAQSELLFALKEIAKVASKRPTHADFGDVKISPSTGGISLHAVNDATKQEVVISVPAYTEDFDNYFYVNISNMVDSVSSIGKSEPVEIVGGEESVSVAGGNSGVKYVLSIQQTSKVRDGVEMFAKQEFKQMSIHSEALWKAINSTVFGASGDPAKQILTEVNFDLEGNKITVVATNGHIMPVISIDGVTESSESELQFTIPAKLLREFAKILKKKDISPLTSIKVFDNYIEIAFSLGKTDFNYKVARMNATYPNYSQLFPDKFIFNATLKEKEFSQASKGAYNVSKGWNSVVKLSFEDSGVTMTANDGEENGRTFSQTLGSDFSMTTQEDNPMFEIAFNSAYLIDGLKTMPFSNEKVKLMANSPTTPAVFQPTELPNGVDYRYLVMPVQIRSWPPIM